MRLITLAAIFCWLQLFAALSSSAQVYDMREMNTTDFAGLDLQKTVVIIRGGVLEEHGPYLPSYTDGYSNEYLSRRVAEAIVARPGWTVLIFPQLPVGDGGANQVAKKNIFPGTYHLHFSTLRAVFMDIASELGEAGFRRIFVISGHGAIQHQLALDQSSDFFNDTYGGTMVHLTGVIAQPRVLPELGLTSEQSAENGFDVHGGMSETSRMLFVRPDLVKPGYKTAQPHSGTSWRELVERGGAANWPGYFGSPRLATAARGAEIMRAQAQELSNLAISILDGFSGALNSRSWTRACATGMAHPSSTVSRSKPGRTNGCAAKASDSNWPSVVNHLLQLTARPPRSWFVPNGPGSAKARGRTPLTRESFR
jgi:creatinine amidohydrolase/Fe(II)-dependent formamide hydrolase-like protein